MSLLDDFDTDIPIVLFDSLETNSEVMGFHVYKEIWSPSIGDILTAQQQPENAKDRFAVVVINDGKEVGHLPIGKSGRFAKTIHFFLRASVENNCEVTITGKAENKGDSKGMFVPCRLKLSGPKSYVSVLKEELPKTV